MLYEYELFHDPETTLNFDGRIESIEHILPQKPEEGSQWNADFDKEKREEWVIHIANLTLLKRKKNAKALNGDFDEKRKAYLKGSYSEKEVAKNASFGLIEIQKRSEKLLDFLIAHYRIAELVNESAIRAFKNALLKDIK